VAVHRVWDRPDHQAHASTADPDEPGRCKSDALARDSPDELSASPDEVSPAPLAASPDAPPYPDAAGPQVLPPVARRDSVWQADGADRLHPQDALPLAPQFLAQKELVERAGGEGWESRALLLAEEFPARCWRRAAHLPQVRASAFLQIPTATAAGDPKESVLASAQAAPGGRGSPVPCLGEHLAYLAQRAAVPKEAVRGIPDVLWLRAEPVAPHSRRARLP
jgi:hypothetical protein